MFQGIDNWTAQTCKLWQDPFVANQSNIMFSIRSNGFQFPDQQLHMLS